MKKIIQCYFVLACLLALSCTRQEIETMQASMQVVEQPLVGESAVALESIKPFIFPEITRSLGKNPMSREELENREFCTLPYYELDVSEFVEDPAPGNLGKCIYPAKGRYFYFGKKDGEIIFNVTSVLQPDGQWLPGPMLTSLTYFKTRFSWVAREVARADDKKYYVLSTGVLDHVVIYQGGEPLFFDFPGRFRMDKERFARLVLDKYNSAQSFKEFLRENDQEAFERWEEREREREQRRKANKKPD